MARGCGWIAAVGARQGGPIKHDATPRADWAHVVATTCATNRAKAAEDPAIQDAKQLREAKDGDLDLTRSSEFKKADGKAF